MAHDTFIKFNGIEGESQDHLHKGEIDVIRWEWSVSQTANMHREWRRCGKINRQGSLFRPPH